jgi:hypothetical protein
MHIFTSQQDVGLDRGQKSSSPFQKFPSAYVPNDASRHRNAASRSAQLVLSATGVSILRSSCLPTSLMTCHAAGCSAARFSSSRCWQIFVEKGCEAFWLLEELHAAGQVEASCPKSRFFLSEGQFDQERWRELSYFRRTYW